MGYRTSENEWTWFFMGHLWEIYGNLVWRNDQMQPDEKGREIPPPPKKIKLEFSFFSGKNEDNKSKKILRTMRVPTFQVRYPNG